MAYPRAHLPSVSNDVRSFLDETRGVDNLPVSLSQSDTRDVVAELFEAKQLTDDHLSVSPSHSFPTFIVYHTSISVP